MANYGPNLVTDFFNNNTYPCNTFVSSGLDVSSAIGIGTSGFHSTPDGLYIEVGWEFLLECDATINSGAIGGRIMSNGQDISGGNSNTVPIASGANSLVLISTSAGFGRELSFYVLTTGFDVVINNISLRRILPATVGVKVTWDESPTAIGTKVIKDDIEIADILKGTKIYNDYTATVGVEAKYELQAYKAGEETTAEVIGVNTQLITPVEEEIISNYSPGITPYGAANKY